MLTRGREHAQTELSLSALTYHLKRALAVLGTRGLIAGLAALRKGARVAGGSAHGPQRGFWKPRNASRWLAALGTRFLAPRNARHRLFACHHRLTLAA